jgi:hypothetical protein
VYSFSILLAFTFQFGPQRIKCVGLVGFHYGSICATWPGLMVTDA